MLLQWRAVLATAKVFPMSNVLDVPEVRAAAVRLTPAQYHRLYEMGIIPEKTELLSGILVEKMPKSPLHTWMVAFLQAWLGTIVNCSVHIRSEQPLTLSDSEPEPEYRSCYRKFERIPFTSSVVCEACDRSRL